jgi:CHAD domain-containing protein
MPPQPLPDQVHDFRTRSRRLEAILSAFGIDQTRAGKRVLKPLAKLRKRAGKVRDMDVLTSYAAGLGIPECEEECSVRLLEHLGAERKKQASKFHSQSRKSAAHLRKRLKRTQKKLAKFESAQHTGTAMQVPVSALESASKLANPARLNRSNLHAFRLRVKELRNMLKMAADADEELLDTLGATKDAIGEWHDWQELTEIAQGFLDHGTKCQLTAQIKATTQEKYRGALKQAEQLRKRYVGVPDSRKKTSSQQPQPGRPVWSAAMKLAA